MNIMKKMSLNCDNNEEKIHTALLEIGRIRVYLKTTYIDGNEHLLYNPD